MADRGGLPAAAAAAAAAAAGPALAPDSAAAQGGLEDLGEFWARTGARAPGLSGRGSCGVGVAVSQLVGHCSISLGNQDTPNFIHTHAHTASRLPLCGASGAAWSKLLSAVDANGGSNVVVVCHAATAAALVSHCLGLGPEGLPLLRCVTNIE